MDEIIMDDRAKSFAWSMNSTVMIREALSSTALPPDKPQKDNFMDT